MTGRKHSACSDRCRAAENRRVRLPLLASEGRQIRARRTVALEAA